MRSAAAARPPRADDPRDLFIASAGMTMRISDLTFTRRAGSDIPRRADRSARRDTGM